MNYFGFTPKLLFLPLILLILSGCICQKLPQEQTLTGDLFREECNYNMPPDIQIMIERRRDRYEEVNDIHNINFVLLRNEGCMPEKEFNELLTLRWKLLRFHRQNEIALENAKVLYTKYQENPKRKRGQDLCKQYDKIRTMYDEYMQESEYLLCKTAPYKHILLDKYIETWGIPDWYNK